MPPKKNEEQADAFATLVTYGKDSARRRKVGDRIVVLPPEGHGEVWRGSAR